MKNIHKLAAIDIGSNAVRLLITSIWINKTDTKFKKISLVRVPLRLGEDVFSKGKISDNKLKKLQKTLKAFKILMQIHEVYMFKAVATSAMREAENSTKIIEHIYRIEWKLSCIHQILLRAEQALEKQGAQQAQQEQLRVLLEECSQDFRTNCTMINTSLGLLKTLIPNSNENC